MVFKTTVQDNSHVSQLEELLNQLILPLGRWIFDLDDCDRILKVEHDELAEFQLIELMEQRGFNCVALED
ncbi:MAG: hypothetical protein ABIV51_13215 [Saprospiraceae bacterium]